MARNTVILGGGGPGRSRSAVLRAQRSQPRPVRVVAHLLGERRLIFRPALFAAATLLGAAGGIGLAAVGAPRWAVAGGGVAGPVMLWSASLITALEPGARRLHLAEIWQDERDGTDGIVGRTIARWIRESSRPLVGVAGWGGIRRVSDYSHGEDRLVTVTLEHLAGDAEVRVETSQVPGLTQVELVADAMGFEPTGEVTMRAGDRSVAFRVYEPSAEGRWEAAGVVDGLGIGLTVVGFDPTGLELAVGVDPDDYLPAP